MLFVFVFRSVLIYSAYSKCSQFPSILKPIIGTLPRLFASQTPLDHTGSRRIFIPLAYSSLYSYNNKAIGNMTRLVVPAWSSLGPLWCTCSCCSPSRWCSPGWSRTWSSCQRSWESPCSSPVWQQAARLDTPQAYQAACLYWIKIKK